MITLVRDRPASAAGCRRCVLVAGFLSIILMRVLKNDFTRYARGDEEDDDEEETGWKLVHGDVFRLPPATSVFCAFIGTGTQLFSLVIFLLLLAIMNMFYPGNRGAMYTAAIVLYAVTAGTAGFISAYMYCRLLGGESGRWAWNLVLSATLFPLPFLLMFCFLNTVAIAYNSQAALPFGTIMIISLIWVLVTLPLTIIGGIIGRNMAKGKDFDAPCRTTKIPREIPREIVASTRDLSRRAAASVRRGRFAAATTWSTSASVWSFGSKPSSMFSRSVSARSRRLIFSCESTRMPTS